MLGIFPKVGRPRVSEYTVLSILINVKENLYLSAKTIADTSIAFYWAIVK